MLPGALGALFPLPTPGPGALLGCGELPQAGMKGRAFPSTNSCPDQEAAEFPLELLPEAEDFPAQGWWPFPGYFWGDLCPTALWNSCRSVQPWAAVVEKEKKTLQG